MQTSTHTTRQTVLCPCSKSTRIMYQNKPSRSDCSHFNSKPFLIYVPSFVPATNSVLNRIIITEEITHIKPLRCHLPGNLGCRPPMKAWQDIRCMGNEICINSVAPSLIYFRVFTLSAREEKKEWGIKKKWLPSKFLQVHRTGVITAIGINHWCYRCSNDTTDSSYLKCRCGGADKGEHESRWRLLSLLRLSRSSVNCSMANGRVKTLFFPQQPIHSW